MVLPDNNQTDHLGGLAPSSKSTTNISPTPSQ
ncbi:hypothetical protein A0J61_11290, partial [Choanephora cucurbitarum]